MFFAKNPIFLFQSKKAQSNTAPGFFVCMYISYYNVRGGPGRILSREVNGFHLQVPTDSSCLVFCIHRTSASASCLPLAYIFSRPARFLVRVDIPSVLSGAMMQTRPCRSSSRARWTAVLYRHARRRSPSAAAG